MKRVLALVAAVAMIGGAFVIRARVIDSSDKSSDSPNPSSNGSNVTIGCAPELIPVCNAAANKDVKVLADPVDVANAASVAPKIDAWVTYGPAPGIVNASTTDQAKVYDAGTVIGSARLAVVTPAERGAALTKHCRVPTLTWKCLIDAAGDDWSTIAPNQPQLQGTVKVGVGEPSSALGTILAGPLALATSTQADPGIDELDTNAVVRAVGSVDQQPTEDELTGLTLQGPGAFSAVVAPKGAAQRAAGSASGRGLGLTVLYPEPVATTVVVLAPPSGREVPQAVIDAFDQPKVKQALVQAGWVPSKQGQTTGLPAPDVLFALRQELSP